MTDDLIVKIAALTSELGRLRVEVTEVPSDAQAELMQRLCSSADAIRAWQMAFALFVETTPSNRDRAQAVVDMMLFLGKALSALHRDADRRRVSTGEMLRLVASHADDVDSEEEHVLTILKKALGSNESPPPSTSGAN